MSFHLLEMTDSFKENRMKKSMLVLVGILVLMSMPLFAQDVAKAEVYGGYQLLRHPGGEGYDSYMINGFLASVEGNVKPYFGIVGEFGYGRKSWDEYNETENFTTFLFGPRFGYRTEKFRVFGHYLLGGLRYSDSYDGESYSDSNFAQAVGGGIDITVNKMISIRPAQIDMISIKWSDGDYSEWENVFRYSGGIVFKFGSK